MNNILILYHSGSGSTRTIGEVLKEKLSRFCNTDISEINLHYDYTKLEKYDVIVFGYPVFGGFAPKTMLEFVEKMPALSSPKKAFIYSTCAFFEENSARDLALKLKDKNILSNDNVCIKGPASDGTLFMPESFSFIFNYENNIKLKLAKTVDSIKKILVSPANKLKIPMLKWYTPMSRLFLWFGEYQYALGRKSMRIVTSKCNNCNLCADNCLRSCFKKGEKHPVIEASNCELCLKCVHNCPNKAIELLNNMKETRLNRAFYIQKKKELLST